MEGLNMEIAHKHKTMFGMGELLIDDVRTGENSYQRQALKEHEGKPFLQG